MRDVPAETMTVRVPISFKRRRGRKRIVAPDGSEQVPALSSPNRETDSALVKAIARAYRWQRMLERGEYATLRELARVERLDAAYVSRILRLTLLAPELVEAAVNGSQTIALDLRKLASPFSPDWQDQARLFKDTDGLN